MITKTQAHTCESCTYWKATADAQGECRRQPPQAVTFVVDAQTQFVTRFPVTAAQDWCGEYQLK